MNRRNFLGSASAILAMLPHQLHAWEVETRESGAPDHRLRIEPCTLEIGRGIHVSTVAYNGQVPGPMLRLRKDRAVTIDVTNASKNSDLVHWHGLRTDPVNDGAEEEGSPLIAPEASRSGAVQMATSRREPSFL